MLLQVKVSLQDGSPPDVATTDGLKVSITEFRKNKLKNSPLRNSRRFRRPVSFSPTETSSRRPEIQLPVPASGVVYFPFEVPSDVHKVTMEVLMHIVFKNRGEK